MLAVVSVALFSQREIGPDAGMQVAGGAQVMDVAMADASEISGGAGDTRIKGLSPRMEVWKKSGDSAIPRMEVWKKSGDSAIQMVNMSEAHEGDEIQLRYSVPEKCYGLLFSMDGNGTLTMHMAEGNKAIALEPGKMTTLPFAYKLDNAPKFEKFFFVTSREAFELDANDVDAILKNKNEEFLTLWMRRCCCR